MSSQSTFLIPDFDKSINGKVNELIEVVSPATLFLPESHVHFCSAIATNGFPSRANGVFVFATKIDKIGAGMLGVGFSAVETFDSRKGGFAGFDFAGSALGCYDGRRYPGSRDPSAFNCFHCEVTRKAKEVISILTISKNGSKKEIQWIVDENEGPIQDCTKDFKQATHIFPCVSMYDNGQQIACISFDQIKSRSPKIEELMKEFSSVPSQPTAIIDEKESGQRRQREVGDNDDEEEVSNKPQKKTSRKEKKG